MANKTIEVPVGVQGRADLVLKLYALGADTLLNTGGDALTERTNKKGFYTATVTENITGVNHVRVTDASDVAVWVGVTESALADDTGTYQCRNDSDDVSGLVDTTNITTETTIIEADT